MSNTVVAQIIINLTARKWKDFICIGFGVDWYNQGVLHLLIRACGLAGGDKGQRSHLRILGWLTCEDYVNMGEDKHWLGRQMEEDVSVGVNPVFDRTQLTKQLSNTDCNFRLLRMCQRRQVSVRNSQCWFHKTGVTNKISKPIFENLENCVWIQKEINLLKNHKCGLCWFHECKTNYTYVHNNSYSTKLNTNSYDSLNL